MTSIRSFDMHIDPKYLGLTKTIPVYASVCMEYDHVTRVATPGPVELPEGVELTKELQQEIMWAIEDKAREIEEPYREETPAIEDEKWATYRQLIGM